MARIEGIGIRNYRGLKDITLGKLWNTQAAQPLTPMTAVIGENGVGKSSLFDAFGFLADCLKLGVEEACDARGRGGFDRIRSQGSKAAVEFEVYYRESYVPPAGVDRGPGHGMALEHVNTNPASPSPGPLELAPGPHRPGRSDHHKRPLRRDCRGRLSGQVTGNVGRQNRLDGRVALGAPRLERVPPGGRVLAG